MKTKRGINAGICAACAALLFFGGVLIAFPDKYSKICFQGVCMWAECVLPSLFPFMVITLLLIKLGAVQKAAKPFAAATRVFGLPPAALPLFLMSVFSGYPAGSRILCEYYESGLITAEDAEKLAPLCSTCGPLFALGTVGYKAFGNGGAGVKLLCGCLLSVVLSTLLFCLMRRRKGKSLPLAPVKNVSGDALYSSFYGGVTASLVAGGFICFFYTLSNVFADFKIFKPLQLIFALIFGENVSEGLCLGLCEATGGCFKLAAAGGFFALPLAGFLMTFGGASIILQQLCYLTKCKVGAGYFILFKLVQGVICFGLVCLFSLG